jgi:hypothetical protein
MIEIAIEQTDPSSFFSFNSSDFLWSTGGPKWGEYMSLVFWQSLRTRK